MQPKPYNKLLNRSLFFTNPRSLHPQQQQCSFFCIAICPEAWLCAQARQSHMTIIQKFFRAQRSWASGEEQVPLPVPWALLQRHQESQCSDLGGFFPPWRIWMRRQFILFILDFSGTLGILSRPLTIASMESLHFSLP